MAARWLPSIEGNVCDTLGFRPLSPQTLGNKTGDNVTTVGCFRLYKGLKAFKVESSVLIFPAFFYSFT